MKSVVEPGTPYPPPGRAFKRLALCVIAGVVVLGIGYLAWNAVAERRLAAAVAAIKARGDPFEGAEFNVPAVAPTSNAADHFMAAAGALSLSAIEEELAGDPPLFPWSDAERADIDALLTKSAAALGRAARAAECPDVDWRLDYGEPVETLWPKLRFGPERRLCGVLRLAGLADHDAGRDQQALARVQQILAHSRAVRKQPIRISSLVAVAFEAMATDTLMRILPELQVASAGNAARREQLESLRNALLEDAERVADARRAWQGERAITTTSLRSDPALNPFLPSDKTDLVRLYAQFDQAVAAATAPTWPEAQRRLLAPLASLETPAQKLAHRVTVLTGPDASRHIELHFRQLADRRLAALAIAIRLYAADHGGRRPASLDELVPAYIRAIPVDPFAEAGPLRYANRPDVPVVYSVFTNGVGDSGRVTAPPTSPRRLNRFRQDDLLFFLTREPRTAATAPAALSP